MASALLARRDPKLRARIRVERPLQFGAGIATDEERVLRGGSALAWAGGWLDDRLVVVEEDADRIGVIAPGTDAEMTALRLQTATRGKAAMRFEAVMAAKDWRGPFLLAFGSGELDHGVCVARIRLSGGDTELSVFEPQKLYAALAAHPEFAGPSLHVVGAAYLPKSDDHDGRDAVRLFQGAPAAGGTAPRSATVEVRLDTLLAYLDRCRRDPAATLGFDLYHPRTYDLDEVSGAPFRFTDAAALPGGRVLYCAVADAAGVAVGILERDGSARYTLVVDASGQPLLRPSEGLAATDDRTAYLVLGSAGASTLAQLELVGFGSAT